MCSALGDLGKDVARNRNRNPSISLVVSRCIIVVVLLLLLLSLSAKTRERRDVCKTLKRALEDFSSMCAQKALSRNSVFSWCTKKVSPLFFTETVIYTCVRVNTHTHTHTIFLEYYYIYYVSYGLVSAQFRREAAHDVGYDFWTREIGALCLLSTPLYSQRVKKETKKRKKSLSICLGFHTLLCVSLSRK